MTKTLEPVRTLSFRGASDAMLMSLAEREWIVTNGLGGYASGTVAGIPTRRFHGLLIAALPSPLGRQLLFNHLLETWTVEGDEVPLSTLEQLHRLRESLRFHALKEFRLEMGLPVWRYEYGECVLEKRLFPSHGQNTMFTRYELLEGRGPVQLELRPALRFRPHEARFDFEVEGEYQVATCDAGIEVALHDEMPKLRLKLYGNPSDLSADEERYQDVFYSVESQRGYDSHGDLWSPGTFRLSLEKGAPACLTASSEPWEVMLSLAPEEALAAAMERRRELIQAAGTVGESALGAELTLAADQFIIQPATRTEDSARARAAGEEAKTIIAGYHWFTDWGRDTMISLEGLTLCTGRTREARYVLRTFADHIRNGLIPNMFPEGDSEGLFHTADATMWFFHAIHRYVCATGDRDLIETLLPKLEEIIVRHVEGTDFGIRVDPADGLLIQGAEGYQLTWMDAKVAAWVVTPRRGKAVEINALWYNALRLLSDWQGQFGNPKGARATSALADRARESFNRRFWREDCGYLYDVVDGEQGDDGALRPNQTLAIALDHAVLDESRWKAVMKAVEEQLLTPVGLRSLAPGHPDYKQRYDGDLRSRDAAYHQGTVWAWLIGPFIDAWRKTHPERTAQTDKFLEGLKNELDFGGVGSVSEVFDAEKPFTSRGCIAQAWSVAELLRCHASSERRQASHAREVIAADKT
jgi:predicted glycogen debranching enzyme